MMKIPPKGLKIAGVACIASGIIGWPISALTFAKSEPPAVLGLSWVAIILTGLAFYTAAQDGTEIDEILHNQEKIMEKLEIE